MSNSQPGTSTITDDTLKGGGTEPVKPEGDDLTEVAVAIDQAEVHPMLTSAEAILLGGIKIPKVSGILNFISLINSLLSNGAVADVMNLFTLLGNDNTTLGQLKAAISKAIADVFNNQTPVPVPPKMMAGKKPTREDVLLYLTENGVKTEFIPPFVLGALINLAIQYGIPAILKLIDAIKNHQAKGQWGG